MEYTKFIASVILIIDIFFNWNFTYVCGIFVEQDRDQFRDAMQIIRSRGFIPEEHIVVTPDGYVLTLHRIVNPHIKRKHHKKPLLLVHGILASGTDYLLNSPGILDINGNYIEDRYRSPIAFRELNGKKVAIGGSLAFVLSQFGYDVWLGNCRGNTYSMNHTHLNYKDKAYWNFSLDEIALYDLPSMIQHILKVTHTASLGYIGHSQGTLVMFALLSWKPQYSRVINPFIALAPVVFLSNTYGIPVRDLSFLHPLFREIPIGILTPIQIQLLLQGILCRDKSFRYVCGSLLGLVTGFNPIQLDFERIGAFASKFPTGVSTVVLAHYAQIAKTGRFQRFDYGEQRNIIVYGQSTPPQYPLHRINTKRVAIFYGLNDAIADVKDVQTLKKHLKGPLLGETLITDPKWSHFDFFLAKDVGFYVNSKVIDLLRKSELDFEYSFDFDGYPHFDVEASDWNLIM